MSLFRSHAASSSQVLLLGLVVVGALSCSGTKLNSHEEVSPDVPVEPACTQDDQCAHLTSNCGKGVCDEQTSECTVELRPLGSACDVELECALGRCVSGVCSPEIILHCNDNDPCTHDICDMIKGCLYLPMDGACDDNNPCTEGDACIAGSCTGGSYVCDECIDNSGCEQYNDQDACNGIFTCDLTAKQCHIDPESISLCVSNNPCMAAACNTDTGLCQEHPRPNGSACSDNNLCSLEDRCSDGQCVGTPLLCPSSSESCIVTVCAPKSACVNTALHGQPCQDGNQCTNDDICAEGACTGTTVETCTCIHDTDCALYDDANLCNGQVRCMEGHCLIDPATIPHCVPPGVPCVSVHCIPESGTCTTTVTEGPCSDGDLCTFNDQCTEGVCIGEPAVCDDANECTTDSCETVTGCHFDAIEGCGGPCETGMTETCNGCGIRTCADDTWGLCEGGIVCEGKGCGDDGCGGSCGTCSDSEDCVGGVCTGKGPCTGECVLGETQSQACGSCGIQVRSCTEACSWDAWSECSEEGACSPGANQSQPCGNCNVQTRTCSDQCAWGEWGECSGQGACTPGDTQTQECGNCGTELRACNSECSWNAWNACEGQGECSPGESQNQGCDKCGTQSRSCNSECSWEGWSGCDGQGECSPGESQNQGCGKCGTQTQSCSSGCSWGGWSGCSKEKACDPDKTKTISQDCGTCGSGTQDKPCHDDCTWGSWSNCKKTKNKTITADCGNCGTKSKTCSNDATWGSWSSCKGEGCTPGTIGDCDQPPCDGTMICKDNCTWDIDNCIMEPDCCGDGQCTSGEDCSSCAKDCACTKNGTVCANGDCVCGPGSDYKLVGSKCLPSCGAYANDNGWGEHSCCSEDCWPWAGVGPGNTYDCSFCCQGGPVKEICPEWQ